MCAVVLVKRFGRENFCETVGELAEALSIPQAAVSTGPSNCCLCNANLEQLGAREAAWDEGFPFTTYVIEAKQ